MNRHPYLRAYMAGITIPTAFLLVAVAGFIIARNVYAVPIPIERIIPFPMAFVPNLWGAWNMLYIALHSRRWLSIGFHGALLPFILAPCGYVVQRVFGLMIWNPQIFILAFPIGLVVYYLAWKYAVGFFNELLGVA